MDPNRDGENWLIYCKNDAVNFVDLWGLEAGDKQINNNLFGEEKKTTKEIITVEIIRRIGSRSSYKDREMRQMDTIRFLNKKTGDSFELVNCQTVVSNFKKDGNPKTPFGNTITSNEKISLKFLGYDSKSTRYKGPVFTIQNANTEGLGIIDESGINILDATDKRPYRLHANYDKNEDKILPMASDGCPMYDYQQIPAFETFLKNNNVTAGDIFVGIIKEDIIYGP